MVQAREGLQFYQSQQGADKFIYDGFDYVKEKQHKDTTYWRCESRDCHGRLSTRGGFLLGGKPTCMATGLEP